MITQTKSYVRALLAVMTVLFSSIGAHSATTSWQDLGGGKARLHAYLEPQDGTVRTVLEVELKKGWSTYWRYPGSSGIPPQFDFSRSNGIVFGAPKFPSPILLGEKDARYAGYKERVRFPIQGRAAEGINPEINLDLLIGLCERVCIPAQASFTIPTKELQSSSPDARRQTMQAQLSIPRPVNPASIIKNAKLTEDGKLLLEVFAKQRKSPPSLFVEGPSEWYLRPAKLVEHVGETAVFRLDVSNAPRAANILAEPLKFTLVNGKLGVEFTR